MSGRVDRAYRDTDVLKTYMILNENRRPKLFFTKADLDKESRYREELDRKWEEEERRLGEKKEN